MGAAISAWSVITFLAIYTGVSAAVYLVDPAGYDPVVRDKYLLHHGLVLTHGLAGALALVLGPLQFGPLRPCFHRSLGYLYLGGIGLAGVTALPMARMAEGGPVARTGFACMAIAWLLTGTMSWREAVGGRYRLHREWMVANYALTFGAVTLRLMMNHAADPNAAYPYLAWVCWVPNLALAAIWVKGGRRRATAMA